MKYYFLITKATIHQCPQRNQFRVKTRVTEIAAVYLGSKMIVTLVFKGKKLHFFRRKLVKIAENGDHNIDPPALEADVTTLTARPRRHPEQNQLFIEVIG
jgi:hypothetical protein